MPRREAEERRELVQFKDNWKYKKQESKTEDRRLWEAYLNHHDINTSTLWVQILSMSMNSNIPPSLPVGTQQHYQESVSHIHEKTTLINTRGAPMMLGETGLNGLNPLMSMPRVLSPHVPQMVNVTGTIIQESTLIRSRVRPFP